MLGAGHVEPGRYRLNMERRLQKVPLHLTGIVKATWMLSGRDVGVRLGATRHTNVGAKGRGRHAVKDATVRTARTQTVAQQQLLLMVQKMQVLKK